MGLDDKVENKTQDVVGKAKEGIGDATGNDELEREGRADQAESGLKQAAEHVKDGAANVKDAVKDAFKRD